jgi:hypothetical protein
MNKWPVVTIPLFFCGLFITQSSGAQSNKDDSSFYRSAIDNSIAYYHDNIREQNSLFNGRMNMPYGFQFEGGIPFFQSSQFVNGDLVYDGLLFKDVPLLFDQLSNYLITLAKLGRLELINEKVERFTISGHEFVRLINDSLNNIATGFYEQLYHRKSEVLLKAKKEIREDLVSGTGVIRYVDQKEFYFIRKDDRYYEVKRKKDILNLFGSHKKEIQQHIKKDKLNFKKDMPNALVRVAAFYDQLTR